MKNSNKNILVALSCAFMLCGGSTFAMRPELVKQMEQRRKQVKNQKARMLKIIGADAALNSEQAKETMVEIIRSGDASMIRVLVEKNNSNVNQIIVDMLHSAMLKNKLTAYYEIEKLYDPFMLRNTNPSLDNFDLRYLLLDSLLVTISGITEPYDFRSVSRYFLEQIRKEFAHMIVSVDVDNQAKISKLEDKLNQIKDIIVRNYINTPLTNEASIDRKIYGLEEYSLIISLFGKMAPWYINSIRDEALTFVEDIFNYDSSHGAISTAGFSKLLDSSLKILENLLAIGDQKAFEFINTVIPPSSVFFNMISRRLQALKTHALQKRDELKNELGNKGDVVLLHAKNIKQLITQISRKVQDRLSRNNLQDDIEKDLIFTLGDINAALESANGKLGGEEIQSKKTRTRTHRGINATLEGANGKLDGEEIQSKKTKTRKHRRHQ